MRPTLALDLSKSSTGWALWDGVSDKAQHGTRELGSSLTDPGTVFARVHGLMNDLHMITPFERVYIEKPLDPVLMAKINNFDTPFLLYGLASHAYSFCAAKRIRVFQMVHQATWRKHFIGSMRIGTKKVDLKRMAMERCRQLGFNVRKDDEADALGILDYAISLDGKMPPWRANALFVEQFKETR